MKPYQRPELATAYEAPFQRFQGLMHKRVHEVLIVSSLYDFFILSEDGALYEMIISQYLGMGLTHTPGITRVSNAGEAMQMIREFGHYDLIITSLNPGDKSAAEFARHLRSSGVRAPIVLLSWETKEFNDLLHTEDSAAFDKIFVWQGDCRIFVAIIKYFEDRLNLDHDTKLADVQFLLVIEDSVRFYSSFLPLIYDEVFQHTKHLISDGINQVQRRIRMRARPKVILCSTFEEARGYLDAYGHNVLGIISDIKFPRNGKLDPEAGFELLRWVKASGADIPILFQSFNVENKAKAEAYGAGFLQKNSDTLLRDLRAFMAHSLGFGDFVFRLEDGTIVGRAGDLRSFIEQLRIVPEQSVRYHGTRDHFSTWLKARTEHMLALRLKPIKVSEYRTIRELLNVIIALIEEHLQEQETGTVVDFTAETFNPESSFARLGGGSLGGKARGLAFASSLVKTYGLRDAFPGVRLAIPPSLVLGTNIFDDFLERNNLRNFALSSTNDEEILVRFLDGKFPSDITKALAAYLDKVRYPLSIRSSSLLEDAQYVPFAGIYKTLMLPNNSSDHKLRLDELLGAVKRVYASTFFQLAKAYMRSTPYRREEEKMAVVIQKLAGRHHENRYYPDFSGVARSYNYYPIEPMHADDGIALVALGLGKTVVEGGIAVRFCPKYPQHLVQFSTTDDVLKYSQTDFFALELPDTETKNVAQEEDPYRHFWGQKETASERGEFKLSSKPILVAQNDGVLNALGSTFLPQDNRIYDGTTRDGIYLVTFSPILRHDTLALPRMLEVLLDLGHYGMSGPVDLEFAVNLAEPIREFFLLQMRPMVVDQDFEHLTQQTVEQGCIVCSSDHVLGHGVIKGIHDIVVVDINKFARAQSMLVANEVAAFNRPLVESNTPYVLIGIGRWGTADPWLGIPVQWQDISGARVIVEAEMKDLRVLPSQGTHFFQNVTSSKVGYFTIKGPADGNFINWDLLTHQPALSEGKYVRHLRFSQPLIIMMDGQEGRGVIAITAG